LIEINQKYRKSRKPKKQIAVFMEEFRLFLTMHTANT